MTKVILTPSVIEYRQAMAELVHEICREDQIASEGRDDIEELDPLRKDILALCTPGQLLPPRVESLWPDLWLEDGHLDGLIQIGTSEFFGVMNVYVTLEDDRGNRLESDYAMDNEYMKNHWGYVPSAPAQSGMTVIVRAIAMDRLGGVGTKMEQVTVYDKAEQRTG